MLKKIILLIMLLTFSFSFAWISYSATREVWSGTIKKALLDTTKGNIAEWKSDDWLEATSEIIVWVKDSLTSIIVIIAIWVFLFIWIKLAFARGNPEEFKKAMMQFVYAVVWVFVVSIAWAVVKLVSWIHL